jgi:dihydropteroate synthase
MEIALILNLTPNSNYCERFLDTSQLLSFIQQVSKENHLKLKWLDIGAESSSPFNERISGEEERLRFQQILFPLFEQDLDVGLSFDTYRLETMNMIMEKLAKENLLSKMKIMWNDISGKIDGDLVTFLKKYPQLFYVFSHNLAPTREQSAFHRDFTPTHFTMEELISYFHQGQAKLWREGINTGESLYLDPCFCFSKTKEQSWLIVDNMGDLAKSFSGDEIKGFMLGLSRKSLLRETPDDGVEVMDKRQREIIEKWKKENWFSIDKGPDIIIRTHSFL